ncbi:GNAT family N-acetyltransferase [Rhodovulum sulfidophilum]|nr:GNAT family N-acetyltransferase [Rhodovulum sulfidophilum]
MRADHVEAEQVEIEVMTSIDRIEATDWDGCACPEASGGGRPEDPFTTHRFLAALEDSGSVGPGTGWQPHHLVARDANGIFAVAPLYAKSHSQGEYVFDHGWADGYERAGGRYYPKLQIAVPFTPATGRRFLARPGHETRGRATLIEGAVRLAAENALSSVHVTFCTEAEAEAGREIGLLHRVTQQFHWENRDYPDFETFLATLSSRKRKNIRKERATAKAFGGTIRALTGDEIRPDHWDAFWRFYQDTGARKWGMPYLTRDCFDRLHETMRDDMLLVLAERDGRPVAGALNFIGRSRLYGRYWGCIEDHPCLHFELCYYRAIDFAIAQGLDTVEAGAQGVHKLSRGYLPTPTHSLHWIADPGLRAAVDHFLRAEREAVAEEIEVITAYGPFRKTAKDQEEEQQ